MAWQLSPKHIFTMTWANGTRQGTSSPEYWLITYLLFELENELEQRSNIGLWTGPVFRKSKAHFLRNSLHWSRRFEYPWAILNSDPVKSDTVLDIGGAHSILQFHLSRSCKEVHNLDLSTEYIPYVNKIKASCNNEFDNLHYDIGDVTNMNLYPDDHFDHAYCISVMEHMQRDDIPVAIEELIRVVKPGGKIMISLDICIEDYPRRINIDDLTLWSNKYNFTIPPINNGTLLDRSGDPYEKIVPESKAIACACIELHKRW